jgi:hypothetical protein
VGNPHREVQLRARSCCASVGGRRLAWNRPPVDWARMPRATAVSRVWRQPFGGVGARGSAVVALSGCANICSCRLRVRATPGFAAPSQPAVRFFSRGGGRTRCDLARRCPVDLPGASARRAGALRGAPQRASTPGSCRSSRAWNSRMRRSRRRHCRAARPEPRWRWRSARGAVRCARPDRIPAAPRVLLNTSPRH